MLLALRGLAGVQFRREVVDEAQFFREGPPWHAANQLGQHRSS